MYSVKTCDLCGKKKFVPLVKRTIPAQEPWTSFIDINQFPLTICILMCWSCGWIFQDPVYDDEELQKLYGADEKLLASGVTISTDQYHDNEAYDRGENILSSIDPYLDDQKSNVLDVGGGKGELMTAFVRRGYKVTVIDLSSDSPSDGIAKIRSSLLAWNGGVYDVIILSHVLEHTPSPSEFLSHVKSLLSDGGILFVEVPFELLTPFVRRNVGDHRHLCYFTSTTLHNYLEQSGLHCIWCHHTAGVIGGNTIPLIRAVATKESSPSQGACWEQPRLMFMKSVLELLRPMPWIYRIRNKLTWGLNIF